MSNDSEIKELVEFLVRPIVGIECLSPKEVFDVMSDRIRRALDRLASQPTPQPSGGALPFYNNTDGWKRLADNILATYRPHEQAAIQKAIATILADSFEQTEIPAHAIRSGGEG